MWDKHSFLSVSVARKEIFNKLITDFTLDFTTVHLKNSKKSHTTVILQTCESLAVRRIQLSISIKPDVISSLTNYKNVSLDF